MMPATRAAIATMTRPIGLAVSAALRSHCTAVHANVAARTTPEATATATIAIRLATIAAVLATHAAAARMLSAISNFLMAIIAALAIA
jgi:hypothetical protein